MKGKPSNYFAPSAADFHQGVERLSEENKQHTVNIQNDMIDVEQRIVEKLRDSTEELGIKIKDGDDTISQRLSDLQVSLLNRITLDTEHRDRAHAELLAKNGRIIDALSGMYNLLRPFNVQFERKYYKDFPTGTSESSPDFQNRFLKLVNGMDEVSVETVVLSLQRLRLIKDASEPVMHLYSTEEIQRKTYLIEHFYANILELSPQCFFYRGYCLPVNHFEPCVFVDKLMISELTHPERVKDRDIIDAGAYIGDSALILSQLTEKKVYAFEPSNGNYENLEKTIELNALTNVQPERCALGEKNGTIELLIKDSASTQFENDALQYEGSMEVPVVTLDSFVQEHALHVGLIKADIEGAERLMLQGAMDTIREQKPALLISIYHNANDYFDIKPMLEELDLGYRFKIRHSVGRTVLTETVLIAEIE